MAETILLNACLNACLAVHVTYYNSNIYSRSRSRVCPLFLLTELPFHTQWLFSSAKYLNLSHCSIQTDLNHCSKCVLFIQFYVKLLCKLQTLSCILLMKGTIQIKFIIIILIYLLYHFLNEIIPMSSVMLPLHLLNMQQNYSGRKSAVKLLILETKSPLIRFSFVI